MAHKIPLTLFDTARDKFCLVSWCCSYSISLYINSAASPVVIHRQLGSLWCTEYVSMGTFSMVTSERSRDFLCLRLQRLRTSSETVRRATHTQASFHYEISLFSTQKPLACKLRISTKITFV